MKKTKLLRDSLKGRLPLLLLVLCLVSGVAVSMVYSKFITSQDDTATVDIIAEGKLTVTVSESPDGTYTISNAESSNMPAYVRVAVVVNLQDAEGNLWAVSATEGAEYTVTASNCSLLSDGYYYYNGILKAKETFSITVAPKTLPAGYSLHVQVLAEGIQCVPDSAVQDAWKASFTDTSWKTTE